MTEHTIQQLAIGMARAQTRGPRRRIILTDMRGRRRVATFDEVVTRCEAMLEKGLHENQQKRAEARVREALHRESRAREEGANDILKIRFLDHLISRIADQIGHEWGEDTLLRLKDVLERAEPRPPRPGMWTQRDWERKIHSITVEIPRFTYTVTVADDQ